jgi:hypothetical protein
MGPKKKAPELELEAKAAEPEKAPVAKPEPAKELPATPVAAEPRYRVWKHGSLMADGQTFAPGEDVPFGLRNLACVEPY